MEEQSSSSAAQDLTDLGSGGATAAPDAVPGEAANAPWYGADVDESLGGFIENKGWKSAKDVAVGYQNLEKLFGAEKAGRTVAIPGEQDEAAWSDLYGRLGRPGEASAYEIELQDGVNKEALEWFKQQAYANGLSQKQANSLFQAWNDSAQEKIDQHEEQRSAKFDQEMASLKSKWGDAYESNVVTARKAVNKLGFSKEDLDAIESAIGPMALIEKMSSVGKMFGEDSFQSGQKSGSGFGMSPAQAMSKINDLKLDEHFMKQYMAGKKEAVERYSKLFNSAYPEG